jgi:hypothetical protein
VRLRLAFWLFSGLASTRSGIVPRCKTFQKEDCFRSVFQIQRRKPVSGSGEKHGKDFWNGRCSAGVRKTLRRYSTSSLIPTSMFLGRTTKPGSIVRIACSLIIFQRRARSDFLAISEYSLCSIGSFSRKRTSTRLPNYKKGSSWRSYRVPCARGCDLRRVPDVYKPVQLPRVRGVLFLRT